MEFRWVAGIALWTFLSGPAMGPPAAKQTNQRPSPRVSSVGKRKIIRHGPQEQAPNFIRAASNVPQL
jgi:hypothetical protein